MKKISNILLVLLMISLLSGCWDRVEIEERGFIVGTAIDLASNNLDDEEKKLADQLLEVTHQYVIPSGLGSLNQGAGKEKAYMNESQVGDNIFQIGKDMANKVSRSPFYEHLQIIVISEEAAKTKGTLENVLDFFIREHEMRRGTKLLISKGGNAKDIIDVDPEVETLPSMYLDSISENHYKTANLIKPARIGDVHEYLLNRNNFLIPSIIKKKDHVEIDGAAVVKGSENTVVGYLNEAEVTGINFITSEVKGGTIKAKYKDDLVVYEIQRAKSKIEPIIHSSDNIEFKITISTEGNIIQSYAPIDFLNQDEIQAIEHELENTLKKTITLTIEKVQKELKVDVLGLNRVLEQKEYDTWKKMKKNWNQGEGTFPTSKIHINTKVITRTTGTAIKTGEQGG